MKKSKISRSLIVVIFVALIIFLGYLDFRLITSNNLYNVTKANLLTNILYIIFAILAVVIYICIKDRLYRAKVKRINSLVYRNIYLIVIVLVARAITLKIIDFSYIKDYICIITLILNIAVAFILRKIIFNVSKSDILSVIAMLLYSTLTNVGLDSQMMLISSITEFVLFLGIWLVQMLIDELKQKGIKTNKYLIISLAIGVIFGVLTLFGISKYVWLAVFIVMLFITVDLDSTHFIFPRRFMYWVDNIKRDKLYKIESFNISKMLISSILIVSLVFIVNFGFSVLFKDVIDMSSISNPILVFINNSLNYSFDKNIIIENMENLMDLSKTYNLIIMSYILLLELLSMILRRRYDTKTTMLKSIFISIIVTACASSINFMYFQPVILTLLIIIAIVNTSSIYLNRDERIKLLVA